MLVFMNDGRGEGGAQGLVRPGGVVVGVLVALVLPHPVEVRGHS